ncbi:unnamed protein product, partial [Prorocentrum cordatum]
ASDLLLRCEEMAAGLLQGDGTRPPAARPPGGLPPGARREAGQQPACRLGASDAEAHQ